MVKNKLISTKVILILIVLLSLGTIAGVTVYFLSFKRPSPIVRPPTQEPTITSTPKPTITPALISDCPSTVNDIDNNIYNTVQIGSQCWLKDNLKVTKNPAGQPITRYCYDNDPKICDTDGGLYDWNTAMNNSTAEGAQGICPTGWHVPKDSEWYVLENGLKDAGKTCDANRNGKGCDTAGTKLQINEISSFKVIFVGNFDGVRLFLHRERSIFFWSSTAKDIVGENSYAAWYRSLVLLDTAVYRGSGDKIDGLSVRCLKD